MSTICIPVYLIFTFCFAVTFSSPLPLYHFYLRLTFTFLSHFSVVHFFPLSMPLVLLLPFNSPLPLYHLRSPTPLFLPVHFLYLYLFNLYPSFTFTFFTFIFFTHLPFVLLFMPLSLLYRQQLRCG